MSDQAALHKILDTYFVPTIDSDKLKAAIAAYRADHPQRDMGGESMTHAEMAEFLPAFIDRELGSFPMPLTQLYWPEIFWEGLVHRHGLFDASTPKLRVEKMSEVDGIITFRGQKIGHFVMMSGKRAQELAIRQVFRQTCGDEGDDGVDPFQNVGSG